MEKNLNEFTYQKLKKDIMSFVLVPGEAISAAKIAERYGVSRTPAREAIVKLQKEGLVDIYPQSKSLVSWINMERIRQEWYVRYTLEICMAERFVRRITQDTIWAMERNLRQMEQTCDQAGDNLYLELDHEFHDLIYDTAGEFLAKEIIHTQVTHYNRIRYLTDQTPFVREKTISEHRQLISAARKKDEGLFEECLKVHIGRLSMDLQMLKERYPEYFAPE